MMSMMSRFRKWYEYERDCNAKTLAMLQSVPAARQCEPEFHKAVGRLGHLVFARQRWLHRLGRWPAADLPTAFRPELTLAELPTLIAEIEAAWVGYLQPLTDADLECKVSWTTPDGKHLSWDLESLLTQVFGHAWYHRGQVAMLVANLDGRAVETDYIFWNKPTGM